MKADSSGNTIKLLSTILFWLFMIVIGILILMVVQSRITGEEPSLLGHRLYIVESGSMEPTIMMSSAIIIKEIPVDEIKNGDVITYASDDSSPRVTHRVVRIVGERKAFITKGDQNNAEDMSPVRPEMVIGRVLFSVPILGYILKFLSSIPGIVFMVSMAAIAIVAPKLIRKEPKRNREGGNI